MWSESDGEEIKKIFEKIFPKIYLMMLLVFETVF